MLRTLEIPKDRWPAFIDTFNRNLAQRPIRLEVIGRNIGDQELGHLLPFEGIDYDRESETILIRVHSDRGELTHRIVGPTRIYLAQNGNGNLEWLAILEASEGETLLQFEHVPELETVTDEAPRPQP